MRFRVYFFTQSDSVFREREFVIDDNTEKSDLIYEIDGHSAYFNFVFLVVDAHETFVKY
jgi:hypothetical protein